MHACFITNKEVLVLFHTENKHFPNLYNNRPAFTCKIRELYAETVPIDFGAIDKAVPPRVIMCWRDQL